MLLGLGLGGFYVGNHSQAQNAQPPANVREVISFRDLAKKVLPAVVSIESKSTKTAKVAAKKRPPIVAPDNVPDEFKKFFEDFKRFEPEGNEPRLVSAPVSSSIPRA